MKFFQRLYTLYGLLIFSVLFIIFFFPLLIPMFWRKQFKLTGMINRWWARSLFFLIGLPFKVIYKAPLDRKKQYIFCPNHFSYADIPTMGLNHFNTIFVGKND